MDIFESIRRFHRIHELISQESTGTPDELAQRLQLQKRQVYNMLEKLRGQGAIIEYSHTKRSYYYAEGFEFELKIGPY